MKSPHHLGLCRHLVRIKQILHENPRIQANFNSTHLPTPHNEVIIFAVNTPGRKGTHVCGFLLKMHGWFMPNFACITARYHHKPFISGAIKNKIKKGALRFCARLTLWLLSFNDTEYRPLQHIGKKITSSRVMMMLKQCSIWY